MANFYSDTMECIYYSLLDSTIRYDKKSLQKHDIAMYLVIYVT